MHLAGVQIEVPDHHPSRQHPFLQTLLGVALRVLGQIGLSNVLTLYEDARNRAIGVEQWLIQQIHVAVARHAGADVGNGRLDAVGHHRLASIEDIVEHCLKPLAGDIRQGLPDRLAKQLALAHQVVVSLIDHLKNMLFAAQDGNEARRLVEQAAQMTTLVVQNARHGFVHLRAVEIFRRFRVCQRGLNRSDFGIAIE